jgi:CDP-diacylglycerol--glycerol-3-phosphate 3-phosphatidyltransferase
LKINLPNLLIIFRIICIPLFLVFYFNEAGQTFVALIIFLTAAFTDFLDGYLARKWNTVSNFGKLMDPLADKLLVCSALVAMTYNRDIAAWVVIVIICREFWITALRQLALEQGKQVMAASIWGKLKTVLQIAMVSAILLNIDAWFGGAGFFIAQILVYFTVAATVISAIDYTKDYRTVFKSE